MIRWDEARSRILRAPSGKPQGGGEFGAGHFLSDKTDLVSIIHQTSIGHAPQVSANPMSEPWLSL